MLTEELEGMLPRRDHAELLSAAASRYRSSGKFAFHYVASKLARDPVTEALFDLADEGGFGDVVDIGCGRGHFAAVLLISGLARSVIGVDVNARHLAQAEHALQDLAFEARWQDLAAPPSIPAADTVLLIDVLYQLTDDAQQTLLQHAARAARRRLIIRTADPSRGLRSWATRTLEMGFRGVWPHAGRHVNARPLRAIIDTLAGCNMTCQAVPCWAGTPFSNMLLVAEPKGAAD